MSLTRELREHFAANRDTRFSNASLREALDTDESKEISNGLFALSAAGEIKSEKVEGHGTQYWMPSPGAKSPPPPLEIGLPKKRPLDEPSMAPLPAKKAKPPKKEKKAKKIGKRKYIRRAPPQPQTATAPAPRPTNGQRESYFAINEDGDIGITVGESRIALNRTDVQRLQTFLKTVAPLWS